MTIQDIAEPRNQCKVGNTRKRTGLQTEEQMKPKLKKKIKTYYIYMYCRMCAPACVGGVGCDAMFRKKFSILLSISTCICRYIYVPKKSQGVGRDHFWRGEGAKCGFIGHISENVVNS